MAGIYIHIPFCKKACYYCDFYFTTSQRQKPEFLTALQREISLEKDYLKGEMIQTIYFGGGTPSRLTGDEIKGVLNNLARHFTIHPSPEVTLEANPDDLTKQKIAELKEAGVNRLSIGVQSFFDIHLKWMNRAHESAQAYACIRDAQQAGISNLTIDLIYGIPGLTADEWLQNLEAFFELQVPHLSAYSLTVEQNTPLHKLIAKGTYAPTDDAAAAMHFETLMQTMENKGWLHYEISNFASGEDTISRHNTAYWKDQKYLGLGPSAHSYNGYERRRNGTPLQKYVDLISSGEVHYQTESLGEAEKYNEKILTGLRTMWGVGVEQLGTFRAYFEKQVDRFVANGQVTNLNGVYRLTERGKLFADRIASDLFFVPDH